MNTAQVIDISQLFQRTFGSKPYLVQKDGGLKADDSAGYNIGLSKPAEQAFTAKGSLIKEQVKGIDIFLPLSFYDGAEKIHLPYCSVSIRGKKTVIKTPMVERKGTVKELYSVDDYTMMVKGFLMADDRQFPEAELEQMKNLCERKTALTVDNALFNIFLSDRELKQDEQRRVVIMDYDFPEVTGGRHVRPFVLQLESDFIFTLELDQ